MNTAAIIAQQLGRKALFMMGAKNLAASENALCFKIGRNSKNVSHITITLTPADTYTVKFSRVRGFDIKDLAVIKDVFVDNLHSVIESNTGLYLSL